MGMPFSVVRTLFAQVPPSIVINEPLPRWKVIAWSGSRVAAVVLVCVALFYAGILFERFRQRVASQAVAPATQAVSPPKTTPAQPEGKTAAAEKPDLMEVRKLEGLDVQALTVVRDSAVPAQLRYEFTISNEGRLYEGALEFLIQGFQDGRPTLWEYPPSGQRTGGKFQMRVGRYMKTDGTIQLPAGLEPEAVVVRLREASGTVRASRGVRVAPTEKNAN